eukprot:GCRY01003384.1.p1 GENE.GCRY01003384.1~~GCRY01003384.1.p1  ORF type:complete len:356 (-),score=55.16 GCRY01003384.1:158-1225(-)
MEGAQLEDGRVVHREIEEFSASYHSSQADFQRKEKADKFQESLIESQANTYLKQREKRRSLRQSQKIIENQQMAHTLTQELACSEQLRVEERNKLELHHQEELAQLRFQHEVEIQKYIDEINFQRERSSKIEHDSFSQISLLETTVQHLKMKNVEKDRRLLETNEAARLREKRLNEDIFALRSMVQNLREQVKQANQEKRALAEQLEARPRPAARTASLDLERQSAERIWEFQKQVVKALAAERAAKGNEDALLRHSIDTSKKQALALLDEYCNDTKRLSARHTANYTEFIDNARSHMLLRSRRDHSSGDGVRGPAENSGNSEEKSSIRTKPLSTVVEAVVERIVKNSVEGARKF